ncbi:ethanolamine ammonia-lyase subunit EutC [Hufsiella ginkgonis]|uniref:Ethanolamine ammonia-lyase small subunit n=1 Tax=Hufsiella ginkgonis TaxID=2695274 RepID=A0A7K1XYT7_9SPHI|nr:ethanolamine ammonia-lyase subunit EutC [Hufsiella ginkgonis]MXV16123.1 ethanolamine ammonia-lyase subunit EutC [Hufsiella ginkgonis]
MSGEEKNRHPYIVSDHTAALKQFTRARIALGRTGTSVPHKEALAFKLAHAAARDAVFSMLDVNALHDELKPAGLPVMHLKSKAADRDQYLQRPDLGREPDERSVALVKAYGCDSCDVCIILADGLSSEAVNRHAPALVRLLVNRLAQAGFTLGPLIIAEQARVAFADPVGQLLGAGLSLILIGERPGLSSPQSMGAYITYRPMRGLTDEGRNCVSNIHPAGLSIGQAAEKIAYLVRESLRRKVSGIALKDETGLLP